MWRKGNPFSMLVGMQIGAATVVSSMEIPQKIKNRSAFWPSNSTCGNISKGTQNSNWKNISTPMFIATLFTVTKIQKQTKCPLIDEWIRITMGHLHSGYTNLHSHQQCKVSLFSTSSPALVVCWFIDDSHSDRCEVISHCGFNLHFSDN